VLALTVAKMTFCVEGLNEEYRTRMLCVNCGFRSGLPTVKLISSLVVVNGCSWLALGDPVRPV
jgi:hypothetical protein